MSFTNPNHIFRRFQGYLSKPVHPSSLGLFRILFGLVMFIQTVYFIATDFVQHHILAPIIHFKYSFFQFIEPLPAPAMYTLMWVMLLASILIATGFLYRLGVGVFLTSFTYLWLLDKGFFNNHYYLITSISFLLLLVRADMWGALKWNKLNKNTKKNKIYYIYNVGIFVLKIQIFVTFFVAGINKFNPYWLSHFQPMDYILNTKADISGLEFLRSTAVAAFFSYGGLIVDILVGFLLWWKRTRIFGIILLIGFNALNFWLFWNIGEIGIFPLLLLASIALFLEPDTPAKLWQRLQPSTVHSPQSIVHSPPSTVHHKSFTVLIIAYLAFQFLFPFRHLLYPGQVDWTGEGQRFSWRMKTMLKEADIHFFIKNENGEKYPVEVAKMLSPKQYNNLIYYPDLIPPIARRLKNEALKQGIANPQVVADFKVKFMGVHPAQAIVSPDTDLSSIKTGDSDWIILLGN